ncbi:MAG: hypothetical protein ACPGVS_04015 [Primorskyibacter sp.]
MEIRVGGASHPGWAHTTLDLDAIAHVWRDGAVESRAHWPKPTVRDQSATILRLG